MWHDLKPTENDTALTLSELPPGARLCAKVAGKSIVVFNLDGKLLAVANTCPHAGQPLDEGELRGKVLTCPYHGYAYRIDTGANIDFPHEEPPVKTYEVRVEDGAVQVKC